MNRQVLKVEPIGFGDRPDVGERKDVKEDSSSFGSEKMVNGGAIS